MEILLQFAIPIFLIVLGLMTGKYIERRHFQKLGQKEAELGGIFICNLRQIPKDIAVEECFMVTGSVVIATDYFKVFAASLRNLFGGEIKSYQSLMTRARREAMVRLLSNAQELGCESVWNIRFETSTIHGNRKKRAGGVEVLVYGTAVKS